MLRPISETGWSRLLTARPVAVTAKSKPSKKQQTHLFRGYLRPIDDLWGDKLILAIVFTLHITQLPAHSLTTYTFLQ
jgi:hypothetical protein